MTKLPGKLLYGFYSHDPEFGWGQFVGSEKQINDEAEPYIVVMPDDLESYIKSRERKAFEAGFAAADEGIMGGHPAWASVTLAARDEYIAEEYQAYLNSEAYEEKEKS